MRDDGNKTPSSDELKGSGSQLDTVTASVANMAIGEASMSTLQTTIETTPSCSATSSDLNSHETPATSSSSSSTITPRPLETANSAASRRSGAEPAITSPELASTAFSHGPNRSASTSSPLKADAEVFHPTQKPVIVDSPREVVTHPLAAPAHAAVTNDQVRPSANSKRAVRGNFNCGPHGDFVHFTTDATEEAKAHGDHYLKLEGIPKAEYIAIWDCLFQEHGWKHKLRRHHTVPLEGNSVELFLCFDDIYDVKQAIKDVEDAGLSSGVSVIEQAEYANISNDKGNGSLGTQHVSNRFDGQVIFEADVVGEPHTYNVDGIAKYVEDLATSYGGVIGFAMDSSAWPNVKFRVEYSAISASKDVTNDIHEHNPKEARVHRSLPFAQSASTRPLPEDEDWSIIAYEMSTGKHLNGASRPLHGRQRSVVTTPPQADQALSEIYQISPSGRSAWTVDRHGNQAIAAPPRHIPRTSTSSPSTTPSTHRHGSFAHPRDRTYPHGHVGRVGMVGEPLAAANRQHFGNRTPARHNPFPKPKANDESQHIVRWKVVAGHDVRTTVMIRNLPNTLTVRGMKKILDHATFGQYDFSYLRVDFSENKNVGYGFVNFICPSAVIAFIDAWGQQQWCPDVKDKYGRVRDARFSYATIQGYDCLVDKFRNSAVMDEFRDYRPKIWHTHASAPQASLVGTEIEFPSPNNTSKKQRSVNNASHIGLYTSSTRDSRRGRFSQFDRGTSAQIREDALYDQYGTPTANGSGFGYSGPNYAVHPGVYATPPPQYGGGMHGTVGPFFGNSNGAEQGDPFVAPQYYGGFHGTPTASGRRPRAVGHGRYGSHHSTNPSMAGSPVPRVFAPQGGVQASMGPGYNINANVYHGGYANHFVSNGYQAGTFANDFASNGYAGPETPTGRGDPRFQRY